MKTFKEFKNIDEGKKADKAVEGFGYELLNLALSPDQGDSVDKMLTKLLNDAAQFALDNMGDENVTGKLEKYTSMKVVTKK